MPRYVYNPATKLYQWIDEETGQLKTGATPPSEFQMSRATGRPIDTIKAKGWTHTKEKGYNYILPSGEIARTPEGKIRYTRERPELVGGEPTYSLQEPASEPKELSMQNFPISGVTPGDYFQKNLAILKNTWDEYARFRYDRLMADTSGDPFLIQQAQMDYADNKMKSKSQLQTYEMQFNKTREEGGLTGSEEYDLATQILTKGLGSNPITLPAGRPRIPDVEERGRPLAESSMKGIAENAAKMAEAKADLPWSRIAPREDVINALKKAVDVGGWRDLNPATKDALMERLDLLMKNMPNAKIRWDEAAKNEIKEYIGVSVPTTLSTAPTALELRAKNTEEAYEQGKELGYWE